MKLNHLNLTVPDVSRTSEFFETYFGFRCLYMKDNHTFGVLVNEDGFLLNLNNLQNDEAINYPPLFHIGFMQENRERVDEIYQQLKADGFDVPAPKKFHDAWTFYFRAPGGFLVEVGYQYGD